MKYAPKNIVKTRNLMMEQKKCFLLKLIQPREI